MTSGVRRLAAAMAVALVAAPAAVGAGVPAAAARASAPLDPKQPLVPQIESISPDYVPDHGPIVIRGTVTNASNQTWTAINVHGFMGSTPITTTLGLREAAKMPVNADVGPRITRSGSFDSIPTLQPGQAATFTVRLPHSALPVSLPGVYWFGVHVLGDNGEGDARVAVGRDRTFIPYVPASAIPKGAHEDTALVVPVRAAVLRGSDGALIDPQAWTQSLQSGPLHDAVAIGQAAQNHALTYLVDPAVPDVVRSIARGNPPRTLSAPGSDGGSQSPSPSSSPSASSSSSGSATGAADTSAQSAAGGAATSWLAAFQQLLASDTTQVMGLPYGDVALESAVSYDVPLVKAAYRRTGHVMRPWGIPLSRVAAPPSGRTTSDTIAQLPRDTQVLLADTAVGGDAPVVDRVHGHRVILTSTATATGGPGPVAPTSSLALRQRILAEAALRVLDDREPLVVELPVGQSGALPSRFFSGLDVPWLRLTTVGGATATPPSTLDPERLQVPSDETPQLGPRAYFQAQRIQENAATLQSVLTGPKVLASQLFEEVTGNTSYTAAEQPYLALLRLRSANSWVNRSLRAIDLVAPQSVTLASTSGRFSAVVSNALEVPVKVQVRALADRRLHITGSETLTLPPHGQTTVLLKASTHAAGVHTVRLELTTTDGQLLPGATDSFPMRSEQVSGLIWVIIAVGVGLLFAAIFVRLTRRILRERARRRTASGAASGAARDTAPGAAPGAA